MYTDIYTPHLNHCRIRKSQKYPSMSSYQRDFNELTNLPFQLILIVKVVKNSPENGDKGGEKGDNGGVEPAGETGAEPPW